MVWKLSISLCVIFFSLIYADIEESDALGYLTKYGYMEANPNALISPNAISKAIRKFQEFAGLKPTGALDRKTKNLMQAPRCGKDDKVADFVTRSSWGKKHLTYKIFQYPSSTLSRSETDAETKRAFNMWQEVSGLTFSEKNSGPVDIEIIWARGEHGDGNSFDGRSGVLAHAYFPGQGDISGDAHFDDDEEWSVTPNRGTQVLNTLTHEFGHSLGLSHSNVPGAIMAPFYKGWDVNLRLGEDDIQGIQSLYGRNTGPPNRNPGNPDPPVDNPGPACPRDKRPRKGKKICRTNIDSIVQTSTGNTYVFTGSDYYRLTCTDVAKGYPKKIARNWPGLPNNIDAAVTWKSEGVTYFFKGSKYWRFNGDNPSPGYPKQISNWKGLPSNIDAAFQWGDNNHLYFFKGSNYWKYDTDEQEMARGYPKDISEWAGVPRDLDGALQWTNGVTYFFKGRNYWRFDDNAVSVDRGSPSFPRNTGQWWYNCPKSKRKNKRPRKTIPILDVDALPEEEDDTDEYPEDYEYIGDYEYTDVEEKYEDP